MAIADVTADGFLAGERLEQYHRDGFATLRGVFSKEEIAELERDAAEDQREEHDHKR